MLATSCADNSKLIENAAPWCMSAMLFICAKGVGVLFQWPGWVTDSMAVGNYIIARQSLGQNSQQTSDRTYKQTREFEIALEILQCCCHASHDFQFAHVGIDESAVRKH